MYKRIYHLSHTDLDGYGSQYMTRFLKTTNDIDVIYYNADYEDVMSKVSTILKDILKDKESKILFLITDLSINADIALKMHNFKRGNKDINLDFLVLDHHKTNSELTEQYSWIRIDKTKCGSSLTSELVVQSLSNENLKLHLLFVGKLIQAHDLWEENNPFFHRANLLADLIKKIYFPKFLEHEKREFLLNYIFVFLNLTDNLKTMQEIEMSLPIILKDTLKLSFVDDSIINADMTSVHKMYRFIAELYSRQNHDTYLFGKKSFKIIYEMDPECFQYFSHFYLNENDIDFIINIRKSGVCSLRSIGDTDVAQIAEKLGNGGGHLNAAGMKIHFPEVIHSEAEAIKELMKIIQKI